MALSWRDMLNWAKKHDDLVFPVGVVLIARLLLSLIGALVVATTPIREHLEFYQYKITMVEPRGLNLLIAPFERWDVIWYEIVATRGYSTSDESAAFFPLFPLLVRVLSLSTPNALLVGTFLTTACTAVAFVLVYRIARDIFDERTARLGIIVWSVFPTAFYLLIPYAESLFLVLAIGCLEAARRNRWWLAGIAGGLAALTRSPGVWLVLPLGVAWLEQTRSQTVSVRVRTGLPLLLVPLGLGLYMLFLQLAFGDAFLWLSSLRSWQNYFSLPWDTVVLQVREILFGDGTTLLQNLVDLGATVFVLGMVLLGLLPRDGRALSWRGWTPQLPLSYGVYGLILTILPLTIVSGVFYPHTMAMANAARRAVVIFPAFIVAGYYLRGRFRAPLWVSVSLGLSSILVFLFVRWSWVD